MPTFCHNGSELNSLQVFDINKNLVEPNNIQSVNKRKENKAVSPEHSTPSSKQMKAQYMKEYMKRKRASESLQPLAQSSKSKKRKYMKEYMKRKRSVSEPIQSLISKFHEIVSQGPLYICTCCDQLWYKHSVIPAATLKETNPDVQKRLLNKKSIDNIEWLCQTCNKHLKNNKIPACAAINGMQFPEKPAFFYLNELECRLLAPRLAFQKIMQAPRGKQLKIQGNIVNVPAAVVSTISMLPRLPSETNTIKVNLKRRLQYKSSALSLNVRPNKVAEAAKWLVDNSNLYKDEGVTFNDIWLESNSSTFTCNDSDNDEILEGSEKIIDYDTASLNCEKTNETQQTLICDDDHWSEDGVKMKQK